MELQTIGALASLVGGLPVLGGAAIYAVGRIRWRRPVGFSTRGPVDVVLATSTSDESRSKGLIRKPATGLGQVRGIAIVSSYLARSYRRKPVRVHLSTDLSRLDGDLVSLGGPLNNIVTRRMLEVVNRKGPVLEFDEEAVNVRIVEGPSPDPIDLRLSDARVPDMDVAVVIAMPNPFSNDTQRRAVMCFGLTTYGTAAAAELMFTDIVSLRRSRLRELGIARNHLRRGNGGVVVEAEFSGGRLIGFGDLYCFSF